MPSERNTEIQNTLKQEIKAIQSNCLGMGQIISNAPLENLNSPQEVDETTLGYIEGVAVDVQNTNTSIPTDDDLLIVQLINEVDDLSSQVQELTAYTEGCLDDVDREANRLKSMIKVAQEAVTRPRVVKRQVTSEHIQKAKRRFHMMKNELHSLIKALIPNNDMVVEIMGQLMSERLNEESSGYIAITAENYQVIEMLKDLNIVTANPYSNMEVKLAY